MRHKYIGNRYRLKTLIGEGGMASVYAAVDEKLGRRVAIKILHSHLARNDDIRQRFHMEAQSISSIDHPNIVKVYDYSGPESNSLWFVSEILYGLDLAAYVKKFKSRKTPPLLAFLIAAEIAEALISAHTSGIIHRDIKPENVMVLENGKIKLMDFGIAKIAENANSTQTGTFMGSPSYMSPEQIKGVDVDEGTDIYSLSVVLYELICGILPYTGSSTADVINRILVGNYKEPTEHVKNLDLKLEDIIVKGLEKKSRDRYRSMSDLKKHIDGILESNNLLPSSIILQEYLSSDYDFVDFLEIRRSKRPTINPTSGENPSSSLNDKTKLIDDIQNSEKTTKEFSFATSDKTRITNPPIEDFKTVPVPPTMDFGKTQPVTNNNALQERRQAPKNHLSTKQQTEDEIHRSLSAHNGPSNIALGISLPRQNENSSSKVSSNPFEAKQNKIAADMRRQAELYTHQKMMKKNVIKYPMQNAESRNKEENTTSSRL